MDFLDLIQKAKAQGADALASATFPFDPPGGIVNPPQDEDAFSIKLSTDDASLNVGDNTKVRIIVDGNETEVDGFNISISFDPNYLQVVDSVLGTTGTQVDYLDTFFEVDTNSVNNTTGVISLKASSEESTLLSRTVAEIEFVAIKAGTSEVKVIQTSSSISTSSGVDILDTVNSINFNIASQSSQPVDPDNGDVYIPKTGFRDNLGFVLAILVGLLLVTIGLLITRISKREQNH